MPRPKMATIPQNRGKDRTFPVSTIGEMSVLGSFSSWISTIQVEQAVALQETVKECISSIYKMHQHDDTARDCTQRRGREAREG